VPLLYVHDPNNRSWLTGYDWSGQPRATVKLDPALGAVGMAPDGQSFAVGFGAKGGTGEILDRLGQPVQGVGGAIPGSALPMWADDNQHICGMQFDGAGTWTLITLSPGNAVKPGIVIARDPNVGQTVVSLVSCSFRNDQAILVRISNASPSEIWVVRISDGKIISHDTYSNSAELANVVGSRDGLLVAENSTKSNGQLMAPTAPSTIIRRVADRSVVATLDPSMGVLAFNTDDSLVLVTTTPWVGGQPTQLAVIDLRSGQALWNYNGPDMFGSSLAQPGGRDFALVLRKPGAADPLTDLVIVHADGTATDFPRRYEPTW
jgi:WD40 repeat protein